MGRAPTIRDVALRAGVSVATASNVVNGGPAGRRSQPPQGGRSDRGARLSARPRGERPSRPVHSSRRHGRPRHHQCLFRQPRSWGRSARRTRRLRSPDRLFERGRGEGAPPRRGADRPPHRRADRRAGAATIRWPRSRATADGSRLPPTVLVDRGAAAAGFDTVRADCEAAGYAAARHLIDLGHRDIAILTHSKRLDNIEQRIAGCRRALAEAGLDEREPRHLRRR